MCFLFIYGIMLYHLIGGIYVYTLTDMMIAEELNKNYVNTAPDYFLIFVLLFIPAVFIFTAFLLKSTSSKAMAILSACICTTLIVSTIKE